MLQQLVLAVPVAAAGAHGLHLQQPLLPRHPHLNADELRSHHHHYH